MAWAKAPVAIGAATFAASLAIAGTLTSSIPAAQDAARQLEAKLKLTAITDIAAFDAIPIYQAILEALANGDVDGAIDLLADLDSLSAVPVYRDIAALLAAGDLEGAIDALADLDSTSAVPVYKDIAAALANGDLEGAIDLLAGLDSTSAVPVYKDIAVALSEGDFDGAIDQLGNLDSTSAIPVYRDIITAPTLQDAAIATGGLDSVSAIDTFVGDGPLGADNTTPVGAVFGDGGIDALAPNAENGGGYDALSALPVLAGSNNPNTNFGPGLLNPQPDGTGGINALSNYDALSAIPRYLNLPEQKAPDLPPAPLAPEEEGSGNEQNLLRTSMNFSPESSEEIIVPGGGGAPEGMRGYGNFLKKLGLNGGPDAEAKDPSGGGAEGGTP